jgi:hypothetical protein
MSEFPGSVPLELQRSIPRPVRWTGAGYWVAGLAVLLVAGAVASLAFLPAIAERDRATQEQFDRESVPAEGVLTSVGPRSGKGNRRSVTYQFRGQDGKEYTGRARVRSSAGLEPGVRVEVRYLPSDPTVSYLGGSRPEGVPEWLPAVLAAILVGVAALIALGIRGQSRMLADGRATVARVTESHRTGKGHVVKYEIELLGGGRHSGSLTWQGKKPPEPGTPLVMLYDPERPSRASRYPLSLVKVDQW